MRWQSTLTDFEADGGGDWPQWDDYGPTMDRPTPDCEREPAWKRALQKRGFSPGCLLESLSHRGMDTYHIDDGHRPERVELWKEQARAVDPRP